MHQRENTRAPTFYSCTNFDVPSGCAQTLVPEGLVLHSAPCSPPYLWRTPRQARWTKPASKFFSNQHRTTRRWVWVMRRERGCGGLSWRIGSWLPPGENLFRHVACRPARCGRFSLSEKPWVSPPAFEDLLLMSFPPLSLLVEVG